MENYATGNMSVATARKAERVKPRGNVADVDAKTKPQKNWEKFENSNIYNALGLSGLLENLGRYNRTDDQYRTEAENKLRPIYDMQRQSYEHELERSRQAYANQMQSMERAYDKQVSATESQYGKNLSGMLNNLTKRGLGRSSLVGTGSVAMANAQQAALDQILGDYNVNANNAANTQALAERQTGQNISLLTGSYGQQLLSQMDEARNRDRDSYTQLQLQINQLQYQGYKDWLAKQKKKGGGSGGRSSGRGGSSGGSGAGAGGGNADDDRSTFVKPQFDNGIKPDRPSGYTDRVR